MPSVKQILFLKDKSGKFSLRSDVKSFGLDEKLGQYYVIFNKGDKVFHYNLQNVDVAEFKRQLEPPFRITRISDGEIFHSSMGVREFEGKHNKAYRIIFENGEGKSYPADYLAIEEHIDDYRSINVWEYLNEVAKYNVIPIDDDKSVSLADKYSKVEFVAKKSLLESYLNVSAYKNKAGATSTPIFPFGCNRSQYKAVRNALENTLSIIQGPPGTGKTQTILNIMANLLLQGKTMQIVSNNNSAVENVKEKLEAEGLGFLCAQLGRADNKKAFVGSQTGEYPDISSWILSNASKTRKDAVALSKELQELYEWQEDLAVSSETLKEYKKQAELFPKKVEAKKKYSPDRLQKYLLLCDREMERKHHLSWLTRMRLRLLHLPYNEYALDEIQCLFVSAKIEELENKCAKYKDQLRGIEKKNERLKQLSLRILKDHLFKTYGQNKERRVFALDEIFVKSRDFLKEYPVILSTTFSATSNINQNCKFDYLIMDEASQVDIAAGALALSCADNAVIVGDLKQLPNVVDNHTEEIVSSIFAKYGLAEAYRYSTNSFLSSICKLYPGLPQTLLKEHYRCNPLIIGFCSKQFYGGELIPMKQDDLEYLPIQVVKTVKGNHARGTVNQRQIDSIIQEVLPLLEEQFSDIGIIAPYNNQVNAIQSALEKSGRHYTTATVHKYQGREKDVIVLSTVDNEIREFTDDPHLLNVAVSRAKKQFTLVVSSNEKPDSNIQNLIDYIEYYHGSSEHSQISSIFDLLYEDNTHELIKFYETHKRVSQYDSENLMYWTLRDIIKNTHLGVLMHYPLRYLITPASELTDDQRKYATHPWTHLDFLVYDVVSHKAKLAIEVDGTSYHKVDSKQHQRDEMKDAILTSIDLPFLRFSTVGSQEKEIIRRALAGQN